VHTVHNTAYDHCRYGSLDRFTTSAFTMPCNDGKWQKVEPMPR